MCGSISRNDLFMSNITKKKQVGQGFAKSEMTCSVFFLPNPFLHWPQVMMSWVHNSQRALFLMLLTNVAGAFADYAVIWVWVNTQNLTRTLLLSGGFNAKS